MKISCFLFFVFFLVPGCLTESLANIGKVPVIGGAYNTSLIIKEEIVSSINYSRKVALDTAVFTIGGLSLDAYVLTLPLDLGVKTRIIERISNPLYAIKLGHFLYMFKDRYGGAEQITNFRDHIKQVYVQDELPGMEHSLFHWLDVEQKKETTAGEPKKEGELGFNRDLIATFVTIYDVLYGKESLILQDTIPDHYRPIANSAADMEIINSIQPLIIELLEKLVTSLDPGDIRDAVQNIIDDNAADRKDIENNKAQAITITLVDFVRSSVLKSYRQFVLEQERITAFNTWMSEAFDKDPGALIQFLKALNTRRLGVQITVDGLQGSYLKSLTRKQKDNFLQHVYNNHQNRQKFRPAESKVDEPKHQLQLEFLTNLAQNNQPADPRYLPFIKKLYRDYGTSISTGGISSTPTISVRNLPLLWTGAGVSGHGGTGIPNFHFVDRDKDRAYYFFGNDALQLDNLIEENGVQTMFDRLNHLKTLNCNAQYDWNAHVSYDGLINLGFGEKLRDFGEQRCVRELSERADVEQELKEDRTQLIQSIENYQQTSRLLIFSRYSQRTHIKQLIENLAIKGEHGMPDYLLMYIPWPDHFSHFTGPFGDEIIAPTGELNRLDYWLEQITKAYKSSGLYDQTLWGMAGDHGLSPVFYFLNPEVEVLAKLQRDLDREIVVKKISSDEGEGPKLTHNLNFPSNKWIDVIVASTAGGNFMMDFFHQQDAKWQEQPLFQDLVAWRGIKFADNDLPIDMIQEIAGRLRETLDYLVVRESKCSLNKSHIRLVSHRNGQRYDEVIQRQGDRIHYGRVKPDEFPTLLDLTATNPYRDSLTATELERRQKLINKCVTNAKSDDTNTWCREDDWRLLTSYSPRPDSVVQLAHLYDEEKAGTINLFPKEGIGYNTIVPGRHAGEHYHEKDAFIGFWGKPVATQEQLGPLANGSLAPTIYQYITDEKVATGENGWGFPSVLNQLGIRGN